MSSARLLTPRARQNCHFHEPRDAERNYGDLHPRKLMSISRSSSSKIVNLDIINICCPKSVGTKHITSPYFKKWGTCPPVHPMIDAHAQNWHLTGSYCRVWPWTSSTPKKSEVPGEPTLYMTSASCSLVVIWNWTEVVDGPPSSRHTSDSSMTARSSVKTTGSIVVESAQSENVGAPCVSTSAWRCARSIRSRWILSAW